MARGVANLGGGRTRVTYESSQMRREVYELYVSTRSFGCFGFVPSRGVSHQSVNLDPLDKNSWLRSRGDRNNEVVHYRQSNFFEQTRRHYG